MRKGLKYFFRIIGFLILFIIVLAVSIPFLFKNKIIETIRIAVDRRIEGEFHFEKADVGLLRTFPNLYLKLFSPVLTGARHPAGDSLFSAESLDLVVDIKSLIGKNKPMRVVGLKLTKPNISLYSDMDGVTNYELMVKEDSTLTDTTSSHPLVVEIDDYRIDNGTLVYVDDASAIRIVANGLDHTGNLRYEGDKVTLRTTTHDGRLTIASEDIAYLDSVHIKGSNDLDIDLAKSVYTLLENTVVLNAFEVKADGMVSQSDDATSFDLKFAGARNAFKDLISLLPYVYTSQFDDVKATGNIAFSGTLKGSLSETEVPVYALNMQVDDGTFQYPGKPLGFADVNFQCALNNSAKDWIPVDVNLTALHFLLNGRPFDAHARIKNPSGNGTYAGAVKGILDLADVMKAYPLPDVSALQGIVNADVVFDIDGSRDVAAQKASGELAFENLLITTGEEKLALQTAQVDFTPEKIHAVTSQGMWNASPLSLDLAAQGYVGWLTHDQPMTIAGNVSLGKLDVNKYLEADASSTSETAAFDPGLSLVSYNGTVAINTFIYDSYLIENGSANLNGSLQSLKVSELQGKINGTQFSANGTITDIHKYLDGAAPLTGVLDCKVDQLYIERWIADDSGTAEGSTSATTTYIPLPGDLKLDITFRGDGLTYDNIAISNPQGTVHMENQILEIHNFKGQGMGGNIVFSGVYNTQNIAHPAFSMKYDLNSLKFSEAFKQIETFQILAPIAAHIQGVFNSDLVFEGRLGENYMPDLTSLVASGFIETFAGSLQSTDILEKISQFLNLKKPLNWDLSNTKNWFEIKDGYVLLQELHKNIDGIEMDIGGRHQIKGDMDYLIRMDIPADRVSTNPVGALAKAGYEQLQSKAAAFGIKLNTIESFVVHVAVRGKLKDPKFELLLFDASGKSLEEVAKDQIEDIKEQVKDTLKVVADKKIEEIKDSLREVIDKTVDSVRRAAEEKLREAGKEVISETTSRLDSTLRDSITNAVLDKIDQKETDKIKDVLDKWDPFKKKKG